MLGLGIEELIIWPLTTLIGSLIAYWATGGFRRYGTKGERLIRRTIAAALGITVGVLAPFAEGLVEVSRLFYFVGGLLAACLIGGVLSITFQTRYLPSRYERDRGALG